jgi:hypothetical protein
LPPFRTAFAALALCAAALPGAALAGDASVTYKRVAFVEAGSPDAVVLDLAVPEDMTFVPETASFPDSLVVSVDGGERFGRLEELTVFAPEGKRPAAADDVTDLRWVLPFAGPGEAIEVFYRAVSR